MKKTAFLLLVGCFALGSLLAGGCGDSGTPTDPKSKTETGSSDSADGDAGEDQTAATANEITLESLAEEWKGRGANSELQGDIKIDGSSTVYPISEAAAAAFKKLFPNVNTTVGKSGTGGGFKRFQSGETDISDASRPIKVEEMKNCQSNDVNFVEIPVAYDGLTIVVHKDNTFVDTLTVEQLRDIFLADRKAMTWKDVNDAWPEDKIAVYAPGTDSGTFDYFKEVMGKDEAIRDDMTTSENDDVLVNGVAGSKNAIGFFGAAYYFQNQDSLKAVAIINPETEEAVLPSDETIEQGTYAPFSRPLFIYVNRDSINKPQVAQFVEFYLVNAADFAREVGYVSLPGTVYQAGLDNFMDENVGTHYLTTEMDKRSGPVTEVYQPGNLTK